MRKHLVIKLYFFLVCLISAIYSVHIVHVLHSYQYSKIPKFRDSLTVESPLKSSDIEKNLYRLNIGSGGEYRPDYRYASQYNKLRGVIIDKVTIERNVMGISESQTLTIFVENKTQQQTNSEIYLYSSNFDITPSVSSQHFELAINEIKEIRWLITPKHPGKQSLLVSHGTYQNINNVSLSIPVDVIDDSKTNDGKLKDLENKLELYKMQNQITITELTCKLYIATGLCSAIIIPLLGIFLAAAVKWGKKKFLGIET